LIPGHDRRAAPASRRAGSRLRTSAASGLARASALATVAALVAAGAVLGTRAGHLPLRVRLQPRALAARAAPVASRSSSWFCTGGSGAANPVAPPRLLLVNAGSRVLSGTLDVVNDRGRRAASAFRVPAHGQVDESPGAILAGSWLATRVDASGGGLSVDELVQGRLGWSVAPCASETSPRWYFSEGATAPGDSLWVSLYNPAADLAVVDLMFVTPSGEASPAPYQGMVVQPGSLVTVTVGRYVQDQQSVAAVVDARSGAVVATELQTFSAGGVAGLSLRLGSPVTSRTWIVPRAANPIDGTARLAVFNPSARSQHVTVDVRLANGPVAPFLQVIGPDTVWTLATSAQLRIPPGATYSARVVAGGGSGVVVERSEAVTARSAAPRWNAEGATSLPMTAARRWVVPGVAVGRAGPVPIVLGVDNPGRRPVWVTASSLAAAGARHTERLRIAAGSFAAMSVGRSAVLVTASGPVGVTGDASSPGATGLLGVPALPQA